MKKLITSIIAAGLVFTATNNVQASTNNNVTTHQSNGKVINVNILKNTSLTKVNSKWFKGTIKIVDYKKSGKKWVKFNRTNTVYVPASKVTTFTTWKQVTRTTNETLMFKATEDMKDEYKEKYKIYAQDETDHISYDTLYVTIPMGSEMMYQDERGNDKTVYAKDNKGNTIKALTTKQLFSDSEDFETNWDYMEDFDFNTLEVTGSWVTSYNNDGMKYIDHSAVYTYKVSNTTQAMKGIK